MSRRTRIGARVVCALANPGISKSNKARMTPFMIGTRTNTSHPARYFCRFEARLDQRCEQREIDNFLRSRTEAGLHIEVPAREKIRSNDFPLLLVRLRDQ